MTLSKQLLQSNALMMVPQNYSVNDGTGIRTLLFFAGCPLRCKWCANPESYTMELKEGFVYAYTVEEILKEIEKQKIFYRFSGGGVTFSGGEAMLQADFLSVLVDKLYDDGVHLAIETSGSFNFEEVEDILAKMDQIFVDIKHMDADTHRYYTGKSNQMILHNIQKISNLNGELIIRIPLIEGVNATDDNIKRTAEFVKSAVDIPQIELLPYHTLGEYKYEVLNITNEFDATAIPSRERIKYFEELIEKIGVQVVTY